LSGPEGDVPGMPSSEQAAGRIVPERNGGQLFGRLGCGPGISGKSVDKDLVS